VDWLIVTYRLPAEPSRHRVAVWRELRKVGAVSLQQATWALPVRGDFLGAIERVLELVDQAEGEAYAFTAVPKGDDMAARIERLFTTERESEWGEFLSDCGKFEAEIANEIRIGKFTAAELDEEEQSLDRLRRWFRDIRRRDVFVAPSQQEAELRLKACDEALEEFAQRVYAHGGER
jgi:hypothetical protein